MVETKYSTFLSEWVTLGAISSCSGHLSNLSPLPGLLCNQRCIGPWRGILTVKGEGGGVGEGDDNSFRGEDFLRKSCNRLAIDSPLYRWETKGFQGQRLIRLPSIFTAQIVSS